MRTRAPAHSLIAQLQRASHPLSDEDMSWFYGAVGEVVVATELLRLGPEWLILHSVPVGAGESDIDHVLVGPPGVFTLNTKHHAGKDVWVGENLIMVNGQRTWYLRNARFEGRRAGELLSAAAGWRVPVTPLIVFLGTRNVTVKTPPGDVEVLRAGDLVSWLNSQPPRILAQNLATLQDIADRPGTWHTGLVPAQDGAAMLAWYRGLEAAIGYTRPAVHGGAGRRRPGGRRPANRRSAQAPRSRAAPTVPQGRGDRRRRASAPSRGGPRARRSAGCLAAALLVGGTGLVGVTVLNFLQGLAGSFAP